MVKREARMARGQAVLSDRDVAGGSLTNAYGVGAAVAMFFAYGPHAAHEDLGRQLLLGLQRPQSATLAADRSLPHAADKATPNQHRIGELGQENMLARRQESLSEIVQVFSSSSHAPILSTRRGEAKKAMGPQPGCADQELSLKAGT